MCHIRPSPAHPMENSSPTYLRSAAAANHQCHCHYYRYHYTSQVDAMPGTTFQLTFFTLICQQSITYCFLCNLVGLKCIHQGFSRTIFALRLIICCCAFPTLNYTLSHDVFLLMFWLYIFLKHGSMVLQVFWTHSYWLLLHIHTRMVRCSFLSTLVTAW